MSSTFIEHSPETDGDKSLILIMDGDGNVTADPAHFEKLINNQKIPDMGIKIVRLDSGQGENENNADPDGKQELKLTVEEIYPETLALAPGDQAVMSSPLEILPGPSSEHINHDMVDPFSQMDPEQLQRLEHALASEQAKQILGENVAAMLDMLSVDDSPAAFLQNSIKNDHCYTNLLPSSDPNGPSFFLNDNRAEGSRGKGKAKLGTPVKGRKMAATAMGGSVMKRMVKEGQAVSKGQTKQATLLEYGAGLGGAQSKAEGKEQVFEEEVDVEESEGSVEEEEEEEEEDEEDNLSDEDYNNRSTRTKRKPKKHRKRVVMKRHSGAKPLGRPMVGKPVGRFGRRSAPTPETRARNEKLNDAMSKIVQSMEMDSKENDSKVELKRTIRKIKVFKAKSKEETASEGEKGIKEVPKAEEPSPPLSSPSLSKAQPAKYPKRENRKPPAHLADAFGPALFSTPDIIRRVSTGEDLSQIPPEKKNFTVGAHSKLADRGTPRPSPNKAEAANDQPKPGLKPKEQPKGPHPAADATQAATEPREEKPSRAKADGPERPSASKGGSVEIQKLIEKQQAKPVVFEEDQDYSDENIDEIYLDPTQMDQSLLEGFSQAASKSEDQLLQEAILLQEQLIESNKGIVIPEAGGLTLEENQVQMPFETETIENIQNEITSAILVAQQEPKQAFQLASGAEESVARKLSRPAEGRSEEDGVEGGNLVVDEGREDRRRNSTKRRRSDEVSDLDSDLDDALSEASWNSEDDPDRLWCICRKPHNNRFMICCDVCEEWFHGKCVGITKTIGKQMEQDGLEWSCPNCTKKKKAEEHDREAEKIKLLKEKMAQSIREQQQKVKESQKLRNQGLGGKEKSVKSPKSGSTLKQTKISDFSHTPQQGFEEEEGVGRKCIMCKGPVRENSIYCSDDCIRKHSQHAISQLMADANKKSGGDAGGQGDGGRLAQKVAKEDPRIVVMDSNSKKFLVGQSAPTIANLTTWLKENPSYHVVYKKTDNPGKILVTSRKVVKIQPKSGDAQKVFVQTQKSTDAVKSTQLKLAVSPNSKQINILQPSTGGGKKVIQIVNAAGRNSKQAAYVVKPKQTEIIDALPMPLKTAVPKGAPAKAKEPTSPKGAPAGGSREAAPGGKSSGEKAQRRKREKGLKAAEGKTGSSGKQDEGRDKEREKKDTDLQIRESVRKTLAETLKARVQECKELELDGKHIEELAVKIEDKLFRHFENRVDTKYKSKYRSLVFNIKDPKNETLYRKIVDNSISPKELVKLSPEELASQELARWREKENQHQLEMIKKTELELMTKGNTYIMKSHKGEQVIESDQSEKVAAVAAEIDPNTPAQELVSAINSVTSTTQDVNEEEEKKKGSEGKAKKREKERRRSKERKHERRDRERRRSSSRSSRSRSHRSKEKKRSRSREREKERSKSRHREKREEKKEKEQKEGEALGEEKAKERAEQTEISTSEDAESKGARKSVEEDEEDRVPSSTVIIKTPDISMEEAEAAPLWKGSIVMADVAKFSGVAVEVSGDCSGLYVDIPGKVDVVGRIPFETVWDYIARMKKMGTKDILVIKILAVGEEEKAAYTTLYSYLSKRSRIGVIGKTSDAVKDFYLYPLASHSPLPQVLLPVDGPLFEAERENTILGIIVRNKHRSRHLGLENTQRAKKLPAAEGDGAHAPEAVPDRSYTPPLPDKDQDDLLKKVRQKRKIRVRMEYKNFPDDEEDDARLDDDDSPYSPGDSDDELPPLPKIPKPSVPGMSSSISKLLSPHLSTTSDSNLQDPVEIQKKIEEINRAIEEQTQQIQSLTSAVPKLSASGVLSGLPLLTTVPALSPNSFPIPSSVTPLPAAAAAAPSEKGQLPLISEGDELSSPTRSYTPPLRVEESIPFLPEVTSKISLPSNLQEILNSIQKRSGAEDADAPAREANPLEELMAADNPDVRKALSVLNQSKALLPSLPDAREDPPPESTPILSRLTDQELLEKAKEMEMEAELLQSINPCPPQPLPPGVHDIPLLPFTNPPPPAFFPPPEDKKPDKKPKLDPKFVFDSEGVPDFNIPGSSWEDKRGAKGRSYKIDIKLGMNAAEKKSIDVDHFDIESMSEMEERGAGGEERYRSPQERDRRRSDEREREREREWKYQERRHWEGGGGRYKEEYRRHGRRERGPKSRFEYKASRHVQKEWDGSIKGFEERQRWRNEEGRREEGRRGRKRADSSSN